MRGRRLPLVGIVAVVVVGASLALGGCAHLVWYGHNPNRRRRVEVVESGGRQRVVVDGREQPGALGVGAGGVLFSDDGQHVAWALVDDAGRWRWVVDGVAGEAFDAVGPLRFGGGGPDGAAVHSAYAATRGGRTSVVVDGVAGLGYDAVLDGSVTFDATGRRLAYVAEERGARLVVVDGVASGPWDGVAQLRFSSDGAHVAWLARHGRVASLVVDGRVVCAREAIAEYALAPTTTDAGIAWALLGRRDHTWRVVAAGLEGAAEDSASALGFSDDGAHLGYVARRGRVEHLVVDGVAGAPWDEVVGGRWRFTRDGRVVYRGRRGRTVAVVVGDAASPAWDDATAPVVEADGAGASHVAYVARDGRDSVVIVDGRERARHPWAGGLTLAPDGRAAWIARAGGRSEIHVDGETPRRFDAVLDGSLAFSRDGRHWGCLVGDARSRALYVAVDGVVRERFDTGELAAASASGDGPFGVTPAVVRRWVAADVERLTTTAAR